MDRDHVPAWLVVVLGLFAIAASATFVSFLYFYADSASLIDRKRETDVALKQLRLEDAALKQLNPKISEHIALLVARDVQADKDDEDDVGTVSNQISPGHDLQLAEIQKLNDEKLKRLERTIKASELARAELITNEEQKMEASTASEADLARWRLDNEKLKVAIKVKREQDREIELGLEKDLKGLQDRIQELLNRRETKVEDLVSDGILLEARAEQGFVIINRGLYDDIRIAQRFAVFNRRGGQNRIKGTVEVIEVEPHMSTCRVLDERDRNDPLIPGDHIHNSIYDPDEVKVYVLAGDFERYTSDELTRFIREAGSIVDSAITTKTHYLVAGRRNAGEALAQASQNGVIIMSENQLLESIRRVDRYKIRRGMTFCLAGSFSLVDEARIRDYLRANGAVVSDTVQDGLQVLIAGENCPEQLSQANLVGATVINENQLVYLMGPYANKAGN